MDDLSNMDFLYQKCEKVTISASRGLKLLYRAKLLNYDV